MGFTISCLLQNHPSDFNRSVAGRTAYRKETQIETRPSLPEIGRKVLPSQASQKLAHDWHAKERTMWEGEAVYASNFRSGPKCMPGVLKQSTVQLLLQFKWKMDNCLEDTKSTLYHSRASSKSLLPIKRFPHLRQLNSQNYSWKNPQCNQLSLCNQFLQTSQGSAILPGTDKPLDIWLILLLSDLLCYRTETLKNCKLSFLVDVIVIVSMA